MISGRTDVVIWDEIAIPGVLLVADENLGKGGTGQWHRPHERRCRNAPLQLGRADFEMGERGWKRNAPDVFHARDAPRALLGDGERGVRKLVRVRNEHGQVESERD